MTTPLTIDFHGKRALVTGASRGIGAAIAQRFAALGAHVFVSYVRDEESACATREAIVARGGTCDLVKANLLDVQETREAIAWIGSTGPLHALVHCAAIGSFKPTLALKPAQWDLTIGTNARALLICAQAAAPLMQSRDASIVSLSSLGSTRAIPAYGAIGISKAALESLGRYLACELGPSGIRVNTVAAGLIQHTSVEHHPEFPRLRDAVLARTPAGRLGTADEVADAVIFLCSPLARWITGQTLTIDGGFSAAM